MVRGDDNNSITGRERWRSLNRSLVWISQRTEMLLRDAEQLANAPEMNLKIAQALKELKNEAYKELYKIKILGAARSWPIDKFRILCGGRYVDLLDLFQPLPGAPPDIQPATMHEFVEGVRWPDVECNWDWLRHAFPAPALAADALAPAANTETRVAEPKPAAHAEQSMSEPAPPVESEPAPSTKLPRVEPVPLSPKPLAQEPPPEQAEQQKPLVLLPDEPQFEGPKKWRPEEVQAWFKNVRKIEPRKPKENKNAYARRLYEQ